MDPSSPAPIRVFLSHTSELDTYPQRRSFIEAAIDAVNQIGAAPGDMRWLGSQDRPATEVCAERIRACDVYVGILGHRYGTRIEPNGRSYTEWEFDVAGSAGLTRLIFLLDEEAEVPLKLVDTESGAAQKAFRARACTGRVTVTFRTPDELKSHILQALVHERDRRRGITRSKGDISPSTGENSDDVITGGVFAGRFGRLRDDWLDPAPVFDEVEVSRFVGREWVTTAIDDFLRRHDRGYFVVQAAAGIGKTTLAARLAQSRNWPSHFTRRRKGRVAATALRNLSAQLVARYRLEHLLAPGGKLPVAAAEPGWFDQVVRAAAATAVSAGQRLVLVVDGLDEAEQIDGDLPLGLPATLPRGAYVIATCRTNTALPQIRRPRTKLTIRAQEQENAGDIRRYLEAAVREERLAGALAMAQMDPADFAEQVQQRCGGVWVYLRYVLDELRMGLRAVADVHQLPADLAMYYAESLIPRTSHDPSSDWRRVRLPLLATLAAAAEPLPVETLSHSAGIADVGVVEALCNGPLHPFLVESIDAEGRSRFGIYHVSLRDFLTGTGSPDAIAFGGWQIEQLRRAAQNAHSRLADHYLELFGGLGRALPGLAANPAVGSVDSGYPLRNLVTHLQKADRLRDLHELLRCESTAETGARHNVWYRAHEAADTVGDYLADLRRARDAAHRDPRLAESRASQWALDFRYTLLLAAVTTLAANIPHELVAKLVEHKMWSPARGLAAIRQVGDPVHRSFGLPSLLPYVEGEERAALVTETATALATIADHEQRGWAWLAAFAHLNAAEAEAFAEMALAAVRGIVDGADRSWAVGKLLGHFAVDRALDILADRELVDHDYDRMQQICEIAGRASAAHLPRILDAVALGRDDFYRASALIEVGRQAQGQVDGAVIDAAQQIQSAGDRAFALAGLAECSGDRGEVLTDLALAAAQEESDPEERAWALAAVLEKAPISHRGVASGAARAAAAEIDDPAARLFADARLAAVTQDDPARIADIVSRTLVDTDARLQIPTISRLAEQLSDEALTSTFRTMLESCDETARKDVIVELARQLRPEQLDIAAAAAVTFSDPTLRVEAVIGVAHHLPRSMEVALRSAAEVVLTTADESAFSAGVRVLAAKVNSRQLLGLLDRATDLVDVEARMDALVALAEHLPQDGLEKLIRQASSYDDLDRRWLLAQIARFLPESLLADALSITQGITAEHGRALLMARAAEYLPARVSTSDALAAAREVTMPFKRSDAIAALAIGDPAADRNALLDEALTVGEANPYLYWRCQSLIELYPMLSSEQQSRAVSALREALERSSEFPFRLPFQIELAQLVTEAEATAVLSAAEETARTFDTPIARGSALALLAVAQPGRDRPELLREARDVFAAEAAEGNREARIAENLLRLLPTKLVLAGLRATRDLVHRRGVGALPRLAVEAIRLLPNSVTLDAIHYVLHDTIGYRGSNALGATVLDLPESIRETVLEDLLGRPDPTARRAILTRACELWRNPLSSDQEELLRRCVESSSLDVTLCAISAAAPIVHREVGAAVLEHVLETLEEIQRWWPRAIAEVGT